MISISLREKQYSVKFFSGRAMRGIKAIEILLDQIKSDKTPDKQQLDEACQWFCSLFEDQFSIDELYDGYPVDKLLPDMVAAYYAVISCATKVLSEFPIPPTAKEQSRTE